MERGVEARPSWWLLYGTAAVMVAMIAVVETSVTSERARVTLELPAVIGVFAAMLRWVRANRGRIELAQTPPTLWSAVEAAMPKTAAAGIKTMSKSARPPAPTIDPAPPSPATAVHSISSWPSAGPIPTSSSCESESRRLGAAAGS